MLVGFEIAGEFGVVDLPRSILATGCRQLPGLDRLVPLATPHWRAASPSVKSMGVQPVRIERYEP
jgi:hypothetical protein